MWQCIKCGEKIAGNFDTCWNCGTSRDGTDDPAFLKADDVPATALTESVADQQPAATEQLEKNPIFCHRCEEKLDFIGVKKFHEGTRAWDVMGGFWELFKNREHLDVYMCPRCGRVEFFVDGVGEQFRPH
jgi:hypothetical protein